MSNVLVSPTRLVSFPSRHMLPCCPIRATEWEEFVGFPLLLLICLGLVMVHHQGEELLEEWRSTACYFLLLSITWTSPYSAAQQRQAITDPSKGKKNPENPSELLPGRLYFQEDVWEVYTHTQRKHIMHTMSLCRHLLRNSSQMCYLVIFR